MSRRLLVALAAQAVVAAVTAGYRLAVPAAPATGPALADYVEVGLISLFIATYGVATVQLGGHLAVGGHPRRVTWALQVAGVCMLAAAPENVVEDGFKVDWLVALWILLIAVSWLCLMFAGGSLMAARRTRTLGLLVAAPPPVALALDFSGWLPAACVSGIGIAILGAQRRDRR